MKTVLITGASSGIGYEFAKIYAKKGYNLVITARRKNNLDRIKQELESFDTAICVDIIVLDLSKQNSAKELYEVVKQRGILIDILINNAGFGVYGNFIETDIEKEIDMIELNIKSLVVLTKLFLKDMVSRNNGTIINVASTAAFQPGPLMSVYYASKSFVLSFTEAIRNEVRDTNVNISVLCPGPTDTEFEKSASLEESSLFTKLKVMKPEKVAIIGYKGVNRNKSVIIPGILNNILITFNKIIPRALVINIVRKLQESKK